MKLSNAISTDLLLLVKGHYGPFTDANMREQIARLLDAHYQIGINQTRAIGFQVRLLAQALFTFFPTFATVRQESLVLLMGFLAADPQEGHSRLVSILTLLPITGTDPAVPAITLPPIDPQVERRLHSQFLEQA